MTRAQTAVQQLFDEAAASAAANFLDEGRQELGTGASAAMKSKPPLRLVVLVTHFGEIETGYEAFVEETPP
jgi:hypothetical protein